MKPPVLVIDDDAAVLESCETILEDAGYDITVASTPESGLECLHRKSFDLALVDFKLPGMNGLEVLERAAKVDPDLVLIIFTGYGTIESAVEAMKRGAFNYITKPFTGSQLVAVVERGLEQRNRRREIYPTLQNLKQCCPLHEIIGQSEALESVLATVAKVALSDANVLVTGASGTGKELAARAIHANSPRAERPFVAVDCAALPSNLLESELFGHEKGAFTGAEQAKRGLLEMANGGTVFFDEIGEMNAEMQAKLLRVLQERTFRRLGGEKLVSVDIRIICSTNRDLEVEAREGRFRQDLLFRLNVVTITLPPLRERSSDLALLVEHFIQKFARAANKGRVQISPDAMELLEQYPWPGNVRELRNVVEHAVVLCEGSAIRVRDLPERIQQQAKLPRPVSTGVGYKQARAEWVDVQGKEYLASLLERHRGNVSAAAREAQISRKSFYELMRRFELDSHSLHS
ncbi:MAG: sigma-54 dependent transcriptional regulator [Acidobacteriia bacterium]|nr:sigma-54 dependent transcriptional regulator [Terriglobia bacterium]